MKNKSYEEKAREYIYNLESLKEYQPSKCEDIEQEIKELKQKIKERDELTSEHNLKKNIEKIAKMSK